MCYIIYLFKICYVTYLSKIWYFILLWHLTLYRQGWLAAQILLLDPKERLLLNTSLCVYVILHIQRSTEGPKLSIDFEWVATMAD